MFIYFVTFKYISWPQYLKNILFQSPAESRADGAELPRQLQQAEQAGAGARGGQEVALRLRGAALRPRPPREPRPRRSRDPRLRRRACAHQRAAGGARHGVAEGLLHAVARGQPRALHLRARAHARPHDAAAAAGEGGDDPRAAGAVRAAAAAALARHPLPALVPLLSATHPQIRRQEEKAAIAITARELSSLCADITSRAV